MEHYAAIKRDSVGSTQQHGAKPWGKIAGMNFDTKVQPREELWNLTNKVPSGTKSKFESLVLLPTCGGGWTVCAAQHPCPLPREPAASPPPSHCEGPGARPRSGSQSRCRREGPGEHVTFSFGAEELSSPLGSASGPSILPGMGPVPALNPFLVSLDSFGSRSVNSQEKKQFRSYYFNPSLYKQNTYTF